MTPYQRLRAGVHLYYIRVRVRDDPPVVRATGTSDRTLAEEMERLVRRLHHRREWRLLEAVVDGRLSLGTLYDADEAGRLRQLEASLDDVLIGRELLDQWERWVVANGQRPETAATYRRQVESLIGEGLRRSALTTDRVSDWLTGLHVSSGTRRKYLYATFSLIRFLRERRVLDRNPIDDITRPKKGKKRLRWVLIATDERIVRAAPDVRYRALFAFIHATGADVSAALAMRRRDLDLAAARAHVPGTKTVRRDRHDIQIESWAIPHIEPYVRTIHPDAPLWADITRYMAAWHHASACRAVEVEDYTLRDARHSWAVRARKRRLSFEEIAEQLGNTPWQVADVYAQFRPADTEGAATVSATPDAAVDGARRRRRGGR